MLSKLFSAMSNDNGPVVLFLLGAILIGVGLSVWIDLGAGLAASGSVTVVLGYLLGQN